MDKRVPQAVLDAAARRAHRAAVAKTLEGAAHEEPGGTAAPPRAASLDWPALDAAPPWLALDGPSLQMLRRRAGSVLLAPALRLWIGAAKVNAAREAVGHAWWWRLLDHRPWPDWSPELAQWGDWPADDTTSAAAVGAVLDEAGTEVLLATLPHGALRHAASQTLGANPATTFGVMPQAQAQAVLALTVRLLQDEAFATQARADAAKGEAAEEAAREAAQAADGGAAADEASTGRTNAT